MGTRAACVIIACILAGMFYFFAIIAHDNNTSSTKTVLVTAEATSTEQSSYQPIYSTENTATPSSTPSPNVLPEQTSEVVAHTPTSTISKKQNQTQITLKDEISIQEDESELAQELLDADAQIFLSLHNTARADLDIPKLSWSSTLAHDATEWAKTLAERGCTLEHSGEPFGENIYTQWSNNANVRGNPEAAVTWWTKEERYYDYDSNTCKKGEVCGHYTQIIWENTTSVGCGTSMCVENGNITDIFVCRYDPIGNIPNKKPY